MKSNEIVSSRTLKLLKTISDEVDVTQKEGFDQKLEAYKTDEELQNARSQVEQSKKEIREKELTIQQTEQQAEASRREKEMAIEKAAEKLKEEKKKLERQEARLVQRAGTIGELQDALRTLNDSAEKDFEAIFQSAMATRQDLDSSLTDLAAALDSSLPDGAPAELRDKLDELRALETRLSALADRDQYSTWALTKSSIRDFIVDPGIILKPFANLDATLDPGTLERLVGVSEQKLVASIQQDNAFGFDYWVRAVPVDSEFGETFLLGVLIGKEPVGLVRFVVLGIGRGEVHSASVDEDASARTNGDRIVWTEAFLGLSPAVVPDQYDWLSSGILFTYIEPDGEIDSDHDSDITPDANETISLYALVQDIEPPQPIWGTPQPFELLTRDQFYMLARDMRLPVGVRKALLDPYNEPRLNFDMLERSKKPDLILSKAEMERINDADLRATLEMLVRSVIAKDFAAVKSALGGSYSSPNEVVSMLGAFALRPQFRVAEVSIEQSQLAQQQIKQQVQQQVPAPIGNQPGSELETQPLELQSEIVLAVASSADGEEDGLTLLLERRGAESTWRLFDISETRFERPQPE